MQFVIIDAEKHEYLVTQAEDLRDVLVAAGLKPDKTDHGMLMPGVAYVVYEFGMFMSPDSQHYYALGNTLIAGNAVLYGVGEAGETVDLLRMPQPFFFHKAADVELAIEKGIVRRPQMAINGTVIWQWPQPAPKGVVRA